MEAQLNSAIESRGFRISPRASLHERLTRYIMLMETQKGGSISHEDASAAATLMISREGEEPRRRDTLAVNLEGHTMTRRSQVSGTHSMVRRSQTRQ